MKKVFAKGRTSKFFTAIDTMEGNREVLVKISRELEATKKEYLILDNLNKVAKEKQG